jgi:hypothetical protein
MQGRSNDKRNRGRVPIADAKEEDGALDEILPPEESRQGIDCRTDGEATDARCVPDIDFDYTHANIEVGC